MYVLAAELAQPLSQNRALRRRSARLLRQPSRSAAAALLLSARDAYENRSLDLTVR
ncbi:MAG: hypothetical protein ACRD04_03400 [Terriglobales bacterium]